VSRAAIALVAVLIVKMVLQTIITIVLAISLTSVDIILSGISATHVYYWGLAEYIAFNVNTPDSEGHIHYVHSHLEKLKSTYHEWWVCIAMYLPYRVYH
jgi:hypothetical protein